jgi:hypothetical protein
MSNSHTRYRGSDLGSWAFLRYVQITRADGRPYLDRMVLLRTPWFQAMLHVFRSDDDPCGHDHPWPFLSLILWGCYQEKVWTDPASDLAFSRYRGLGSIALCPAQHVHQVTLIDGKPCWTLFISGPKTRSWGFWTRYGWIPWRRYNHSQHCA